MRRGRWGARGGPFEVLERGMEGVPVLLDVQVRCLKQSEAQETSCVGRRNQAVDAAPCISTNRFTTSCASVASCTPRHKSQYRPPAISNELQLESVLFAPSSLIQVYAACVPSSALGTLSFRLVHYQYSLCSLLSESLPNHSSSCLVILVSSPFSSLFRLQTTT